MNIPVALPERTGHDRYHPSPDLSVEWVAEGRIIVFTLSKTTVSAIDTYVLLNRQFIDQANQTPQRYALSIQDISHKDTVLTPYFRQQLDAIARLIEAGKAQHRAAVILPPSVIGNIFALFGNLFSRKAKKTVQKFFTNRAEGLAWLETFLDKDAPV